MGTSALLSLGMRAMFANQAALTTIGQNIANASTPGYSRQSVTLTTPQGQFTGSGYFGKGVNVQTVTRAHNEFLTREASSSKSVAFMDATSHSQLLQLEKLFSTGEAGIGYSANQFLNAMVDVSKSPSDISARQVVLGRAGEMASRFQTAGQQLADLQAGVVSDLKANVAVVNQLSKQIAAANDQIARANGSGHTANDLLDKRDQLISELSQYVQVSTLPSDDGTMGVFIGGGQRLVLGSQAQELKLTADPYDGTRVQLSIEEANGARVLDESSLTGGSLTALLRFQNKDLQDARNMIGRMAVALADRVNEQQALGLDLSGTTGAPIFSYAAPRSLPASTNARNPDGSYASSLTVAITDASLLRAESYTVKADPSGVPDQYVMTTRPGGISVSLSAAQIEAQYGFSLTAGGAPLTADDSFLIEPVAQAAVSMTRALDNPSGIAAASPVTAVVGTANTGTATIASLAVANDNFDIAQYPVSVAFQGVNNSDPARPGVDYVMTMSDGSTVTGTWYPGEALGSEPLSGVDFGFRLALNGVPKTGDTLTIDPTKSVASNNGNAQAFLAIQKEAFVGRGVNGVGATISDAYA
ncbi:MAG TPA: flagellar hook-associated protein FlgK, partial [Roseateles sp.]|nr:flagellar hook-associated protein FlgK [Roseateles sp.]